MGADAAGAEGKDGTVQPDPGGNQAAIDRYRDLAKYLIMIFAGVGALLVAGTQVSSIGQLSLEEQPWRVSAVTIGLLLAIVAIAAVIWKALDVLRPVEMNLDQVVDDAKLRAQIDERPWLLGRARDVTQVRDNLCSNAFSEEDRDSWLEVADGVAAEAAYLRMRETFDGAWRPMLISALVGVAGITFFAWGANPPADDASDPVVRPAPAPVDISLTDDGRAALSKALGGDSCSTGPIAGLAIGGTEEAPRVVTFGSGSCEPAQFVLHAAWGAAVATARAPAK